MVRDLPHGTSDDPTFLATWDRARGPFAWLQAVNNNPIGVRFQITGLVFLLVGGLQALFMRLQLARPESGLISPELYNQLFTMHGSTMLFLFVVPILEGFATLIAPSMLGSRDLPFPRLTAFAYWAYLFGGVLMYSSFLFGAAPNGGWFAYVPLTGIEYSPGPNIDFWLLGLELAEASGIISAFEIIIAVMTMRAPGMTLGRLPIFLWAMLVTSAMILFAFMTVLIASLYLELDRKFGTAFFDPDLGGSPLLWQHLFWFFGHPEVYIQFLPAAGMISMIIPVFSRRPLTSRAAVVLALVSTGFLSFGLWAHHMFTVGLPDITMGFFSTASIVIAIPTGVQFFVWIATMWRGSVVWKTPMLFAMGFLVIFLIGGLTGVMVGVAPFDWQVHDSYFVVAHFHYVLIGGVVFPLVAGFHFWLPKISGRMPDERLGRWSFWLMFIGFNVAFFPMHLSGLRGMPRRVYTYQAGTGLELLNLISTIGAFVFAAGVLLFVVNIVRSSRRGERAGPNPWSAYSLEWASTSPPTSYGFRQLPIVSSSHPLWEQERLDEGDEDTVAVVKLLSEWPRTWQAAIVSDIFTGRIREVFWLANTSFMPVTLATGLALAFGAMIYDLVWPALIGLVIAAIAYGVWRWPNHPPVERNREYEREFERYGVRVYTHSSPTVARWTTVLTLAIAASSFGTLLFTYFFLGVRDGAAPFPAGPLPGSGLALAGLGLVAIAGLAAVAAHRFAAALARGPALAAFGAAALAAVVGGALQLVAYTRLDFGWTSHAHGSIFYLLAAFGLLMLLAALVMTTTAQLRLAFDADPHTQERVRVTAGNAALTWYAAVAVWLITFLVLYGTVGP